jgi:hypothetical protein
MPFDSIVKFEPMDGEWRVEIDDMIFFAFETEEEANAFNLLIYPDLQGSISGVGFIGDLDNDLELSSDN